MEPGNPSFLKKTWPRPTGNPLDDLDLLIGSTALYLNYPLVTNNKAHFRRIEGLDLESWEEA